MLIPAWSNKYFLSFHSFIVGIGRKSSSSVYSKKKKKNISIVYKSRSRIFSTIKQLQYYRHLKSMASDPETHLWQIILLVPLSMRVSVVIACLFIFLSVHCTSLTYFPVGECINVTFIIRTLSHWVTVLKGCYFWTKV